MPEHALTLDELRAEYARLLAMAPPGMELMPEPQEYVEDGNAASTNVIVRTADFTIMASDVAFFIMLASLHRRIARWEAAVEGPEAA